MVNTKILEPIRNEYLEKVVAMLTEINGADDVKIIGSNEVAIPIEKDGEEGWLKFTIAIPKGSRDGDDFDGYSLAEDYEMHLAEKKAKAEAEAKKKADKIAKDKKAREEKAKAKAEK